ncbi:hypothetical protein AAVH_30014 [Aphelenchoides avenae]|nr:hypothetical protein AAVH_30014 [Aphelenchus avenae]
MARTVHRYYDDFLDAYVTDFRKNGVLFKQTRNYGNGTIEDLLYEDGILRYIYRYEGDDLVSTHAIAQN